MKETYPVHLAVQYAGIEFVILYFEKSLNNISFFLFIFFWLYREVIQVPRGGVSVLPPSFLVNQLLDLMTRKRREIIPKCGVHFSQELLFCETCDVVFCSHCSKGSHESSTINYRDSPVMGNTILKEHTVVPLSIAIKRMSEIFLYKTNEISSKVLDFSFH